MRILVRLSTIGVVAGFVVLALGCAIGQQTGEEIVVEVTDASSQSTASAERYASGYHSSVQGQTIQYHSSDPDADSALLVRGQSVAPSIPWETDPMPDVPGGFARFIWLAGIEGAGFAGETESHSFDFLINGQRWF